MRSPAALKWIGLALLGIAIAAGIAFAASRLASRQIGLASEPISAGDALAPPTRPHHAPPQTQRGAKKHPTGTIPIEAEPPAASPPPEAPETIAPEATAPEPQPESPNPGEGERGGGQHADD